MSSLHGRLMQDLIGQTQLDIPCLRGYIPIRHQILWMKKEMVLGFGILNNDLAALLCKPEEFGGFTLVRLMSSGKLELQRYHASWVAARSLEFCHKKLLCLGSPSLYSVADEKCNFPKGLCS